MKLEQLLSISKLTITAKSNLSCIIDFISTSAPKSFIDELVSFYVSQNGFYAFESALWIYQYASNETYSLEKINNIEFLNKYKEKVGNFISIGSDALGNQFIVNNSGYFLLDLETSELEFIAENLESWANAILADYNYLTAFPSLHNWQLQNNAIKLNMRLGAKTPFILGGEFNVSNLFEVDIIELIKFKSKLFAEIESLPPGSEIQFKIVD